MNLALAGIAAVTIAGAVLAIAARDPRATILGLMVVLLAAPLIATPWPGPLPIVARLAAALLATRLLVVGLRGEGELVGEGSRIGWPAEALAAAAAAVAGFASHGLGAAGLGPAEAQAAGFALGAIAAAPLVTGRDVLRLGVGSLLLLQGALLVRQALGAPATDGEQLVISLLTIALGGAVAVIVAAARAAGRLTIADDEVSGDGSSIRRSDAHRTTDRDLGRRLTPAATQRPAPRPRSTRE